ncbi:MAG: hypothetical protein HIU92_07325 [Proteobacteria bacterium]|nr:hypothetical protein [Pseudomonadota bacterium]
MTSERPASCVDVQDCGQDRLVYRVTLPPEAMPPVPIRALEQAWDAAHEAAASSAAAHRRFSFLGTDGRIADFDLDDRDARHWAGAVDRVAGLATLGGISLCLRLLALVDLMATSPWAFGFMTPKRDGARLDRALFRAAARAELTEEARFDEASLRRNLPERLSSTAFQQPFTGVSA